MPFETDQAGEFSGVLGAPFPGGRWPVYVEAREPRVVRNLEDVAVHPDPGTGEAQVDIVLPGGALEGVVVDETGVPVARWVLVSAQHVGGDDLVQAVLEPADGGRFRFDGLPEGSYLVVAKARGASSDYESATVQEAEPAQLTLELTEERPLVGLVVGPGGAPIPGAMVRVSPAQSPIVPVPAVRTDETGRFRAQLPPGTAGIGLVVRAAGFAYKIARMDLPEAGEITVRLDRQGGTLQVPPAQPDPEHAYVLHGGFFENLSLLVGWAALNSAPAPSGAEITIPQMEAGDYVVCWMKGDIRPLLAGALAGSEQCVAGQLLPGQQLRLSRKAAGGDRASR